MFYISHQATIHAKRKSSGKDDGHWKASTQLRFFCDGMNIKLQENKLLWLVGILEALVYWLEWSLVAYEDTGSIPALFDAFSLLGW